MSEKRQNSAAFDLWVKACEEMGTKIYPLEGSGDHAVYKMWNEYEQGNYFYRTGPIFRVWIHGEDRYCGNSLLAACLVWERDG